MFNALKNMDPYYPEADTYIKRSSERGMEIPQEEVESLFREYALSPLLAEVSGLISSRLGSPDRPYDIWYDGFKARSPISEEELDRITKARYPNVDKIIHLLESNLIICHLYIIRENWKYLLHI